MANQPEVTWPVYHTHNGPCPYRPVGEWDNLTFYADHLPAETYERLLERGFRRSGTSVYHPICQSCNRCIPLRVNTDQFRPSKSQRRAQRRNTDLTAEHCEPRFREDVFALYKDYQQGWHQRGNPTSPDEFEEFLLLSPVPSEMILFRDSAQQLVGVSWIDLLPNALSSVYFAFHPQEHKRRLGVFSLLYEIEYAYQLQKPWLYLGYWVPDSPKMSYKADYQPTEIYLNQEWTPLTDELRHEF